MLVDLSISKENTLYLKGIAILFVILGHLGWLDGTGAWGVHIFCFASGYGLLCSSQINGLDRYWKKKLENVYLPYLFCTVIFLFIRWGMKRSLGAKVLFVSLMGLDFGLNSDPTMWYISYIFACYFVFWLYVKLSAINKFVAVSVAAVLWGAMHVAGLLGIIWHHGTIAWAYVFTFPLGILVGWIRKRQIRKSVRNVLCSITGLLALFVVVLRYGKAHGGVEQFLYTFSAFTVVLMIMWITDTLPLSKYARFLAVLGKYSFFMYLNEAFLIQIKFTYFKQVNDILMDILLLITSFLLAVGLSKTWDILKSRLGLNLAVC